MDFEEHAGRQREYYKKRHTYMNARDSNYINKLINSLIHFGDIKKYHNILEIGCGKGRFSFPLLNRGYSLTCIDISENLLKDFKNNLKTNMRVSIINGDINKAPKRFENKFDFIIGFYILHHLGDLKKSFESMKIMLKNGGKILFSENNPYNPMYYIQMLIVNDISWKEEKGILNMRKKTIFPLLESLGFKKISIERYGFFPPFIINKSFGNGLDKRLEKIKMFNFFLPYQIIYAEKPD